MKNVTKKAPAKSKAQNAECAEIPEMTVQDLLHADHRKVGDLFFQFSQSDDETEKEELVETIIKELYIHTTAEEEIVYTKLRAEADDSKDMMDEADTEHHMIKVLMAELSNAKASDDHYDAKVTVLCELVKHHVREEEKEMFKKIKDADIDSEELAQEVMARKEELKNKAVPKINPEANSDKPKRTAIKKTLKKIA